MQSQDLPVVDPAEAIRELLVAGDSGRAYRLAVEATRDSLYRYLKHLLRNEEAAHEVFQETYLRVFRSLQTFRWEASLTTWVLTIGRNLALNRIRKDRKLSTRERSLDDGESGVPEPAAGGGEPAFLSRSLVAAVEALPEARKEAVLLFYVEERTLAEISSLTGRPVNTVKSDLLRARRDLRVFLEERAEV